MAAILQQPYLQVVLSTGPVPGATVTFYEAGTTDLQAIYSDAALSVALPNPMTTNANGYLANASGDVVTVFLQSANYDIVVQDADSNTLMTLEDFNPASGVQASSAKLAAFAGLAGGGNKLPYFTGTNTMAQTDLTSFARTFLSSSNSSEAETNLGIQSEETGVVKAYAGTTAPSGYLLCYGQAVSRTTYADLFAVISTTFGVGDGSTTFNVPDLRGRVITGKDDMGGANANRISVGANNGQFADRTLGQTGGKATIEMAASTRDGLGNLGGGAAGNYLVGVDSGSASSTSASGQGLAFVNSPPAMLLNYIIKT